MATISSTIKLVDQMSSQLSTIETNINSMKNTLKGVTDQQSSIDGFSWNTFIKNAEEAGEKMVKVGKKMTVAMTTPLVMLGKKLYGTATDYESAFAGVKKTTDATEEEYQALYEGLLQIAETNPTGFVDAAGIMEMAGQLGVAKEELIGFTQAYIGLQESTNIQGENGAADTARFLNVTEKSTANIERVGGVIVGLGNNFATTEQEILAMATRMGATADLAGFSSAEILAFSAALSSVGINAEAGGSAAGKLMKKMQLAAEVGGSAAEKIKSVDLSYTDDNGVKHIQYLSDMVSSGLELVNYLAGAKKDEKVDIASQLGITTEALDNLADSWLLFDQFSEVMGITGEEFLSGWDESAAQSMLQFFQGLGNLDPESGNSILAQLAEMDITEIRLSNLVAAMAGNADLFQAALAEAYKQYGMDTADNAMAVEVSKRYETQESQNAMLGNKLENSMADLGENLVSALQPALDKVNELLTAFNSLSEADQDKIIAAFAVFAVGGPIVTAIGGTIEAVGKIASGFGKVYTKISGFMGSGGLTALLTNPATWGIAAGGALLLFISYLDSIPSKFEELAKGVVDIPITIDSTSYDDTMTKIQEVQEALNGLKPGEVNVEYENTVAAVKFGYGTNEMYGTALAYEAAKANANLNQVASEYAAQMQAVQKEMTEAAASGDTETADKKFAEMNALRAEMDAQLAAMKADYTQQLSEIFSGMASQYPEAASALTEAAANYDIVLGANNVLYEWDEDSFDSIEASTEAWTEQAMKVVEQAFNAGLYDDENNKGYWNEMFNFLSGTENVDYWNIDTFRSLIENGSLNLSTLLEEAFEDSTANLQTATQAISDNPVLASWLQAMINDPTIAENLDVTNLTGALEGIFKALDFKNALTQAGTDSPYDFGKYVSEGLGSGISENASIATGAGNNLGTDTINNIKSALGVNSPSTYAIAAGLNVDQGLMMGINSGSGMVVAAARALATRVLSAMKAEMGIHSPSDETYYQGEMLMEGYINGIRDNASRLEDTVITVIEGVEQEWNDSIWDMISSFAETEQQALSDEFNHVEDAVTIDSSFVEKIRQLAEREVINKFTTAEVKVEMNNTNNINSDMDIDGIIAQLEDKVAERLEVVAEGVYN